MAIRLNDKIMGPGTICPLYKTIGPSTICSLYKIMGPSTICPLYLKHGKGLFIWLSRVDNSVTKTTANTLNSEGNSARVRYLNSRHEDENDFFLLTF